MIDCVYYNDDIRCYRDGRVERWFKNCYWRIVENTSNSNNGYNNVRINNKMIMRHRLIAFCFLGLENIIGKSGVGDIIDHIDRNTLNNAVENLRITTHQGNQQNRKCKGYNWNKRDGKFQAEIVFNGKKISLGYYTTAEEARQAYLDGKRKYHTTSPITAF